MVMMKAVCCYKHWLDLCYPTDNNFDDANVYHFVINYIIPLCQPHPSKPYLSNQTQKLSSNQKFWLGPLSKDFKLSYLFHLHHKVNLIDLNDGLLYHWPFLLISFYCFCHEFTRLALCLCNSTKHEACKSLPKHCIRDRRERSMETLM